ncbi:MAG: hypothetical protein IT375_19595 [Polyangiaceae bacterium]|jgi:hypothetical protein|nr:hypothetical protein [Polyangiaceae bacterium]MCK6537550.1 hypothetical protein [Polyangiaceae bacterium]
MYVARLLAVLVTGTHQERASVMHESILLRLADGSLRQGREQVLASLDRSGPYHLMDAGPDTLSVALEVEGVPGYLTFTLRGEAIDDRLIAVHVEV